MLMTKTVRNPARLADKLCSLAGPVLAKYYRPDCCIAAARVVIDVYAEFGLTAREVPVKAVVWNPAYAARVLDGRPCTSPEEMLLAGAEDGSWAVGVGCGPPTVDAGRPGYPGHLVVAVGSIPDRSVLIDLSLGQATRPYRDIRLGPLAFRCPAGFWAAGADFVWASQNRCSIGYQLRPRSGEAEGYKQSGDWREPGSHDRAVVELIRACR